MKRIRKRAILIATTLAFVAISTGVIAAFFATPAQAHSSTVTVLDGQILVRHAGGQFGSIADGEVIGAGDTVRTAAASHGVLTFFDGTTVELEPDTELTVDSLQASASGDKIVEMSQTIGRTWHVVTHLASSNSKYVIKTAASTAAVRGTAFEVSVAPDGTTATTTTEGDVATSAQGAEVHVLAGQFTSVTQGAPPPSPAPAPEPAATVTITVDLTQNALVTDGNGRSVGVQNGLPVRYVPGSKVEVVGGKLVVTIPNAQLGVLSTFVKPDAPPVGGTPSADVTVQTQVTVKDVGVVANSLTSRPVENGAAKGAVVVTGGGLLIVPNSDAQNAPAPHIGKAPPAPTGIFPLITAPTPAPLLTIAPATPAPTGPTGPIGLGDGAPKPLDVTAAAFIPFRSSSSSGLTTVPANSGAITLTTPIEPIFRTTPTVPSGPELATPTPAPTFTLPPSLRTITGAAGPATEPFTVPSIVFATPTPAALPPVIVVTPIAPSLLGTPPLIEARPTATPVPPTGGFAPPLGGLVPAVPFVPTPAPTPNPILVAPPILTQPIVVTTPAPTPAPALNPILVAPPILTEPIVVTTPAPTPAPTLNPILVAPPVFSAPTPAPTLQRFCTRLLGC